MVKEHETSAHPWGTLEELLLASAVNRHGTNNWDSIAMELQSRRTTSTSSSSSSPSLFPLFTPQLCRDKFLDLKRRFVSQNDNASSSSSSSSSSSGLVDQLRKNRVEELRRELQQHDVSIESRELKLKRMVEERERSLKEEADLDRQKNKLSTEIVAGKPAAGDDSGDRDDRSFNESNSTSQKPEKATTNKTSINDEQNVDVIDVKHDEKAQVKTETVEPDPVRTGKGLGRESLNGEQGDNKKQMSDVQSSASLSRMKRRRFGNGGGSSSGEEREGDEISPAKKRASTVKPGSLARLLGIIRPHRLGSAFGRCKRSQESERYKNLIRQHMDLGRIESRLDKGVYSDCRLKFFRDLLLLFNNIIVFHSKDSPEHITAQQLRAVVLKDMSDKLWKKTARPSSSLSKPNNKSSTVTACSKRSSVNVSTDNARSKGDKKERKVDEKSQAKDNKAGDDNCVRAKRSKEATVSGRRNPSRSGSSKSGETKLDYGGNELSSHDIKAMKEVDKKENMARKKQGAASFLKRMKRNSPSRMAAEDGDGGGDDSDDSEDESKDSKEEKGKGKKREVKRVTRSSGGRGAREENGRVKRGVGRPPKIVVAAAAASPESTGKKRRRDGVENEVGVGVAGKARKRSTR